MRLRGSICIVLVASSVVACRGDGPDVRDALGARIVGKAELSPRGAGERERNVIAATASLPAATYTAEQAARGAPVYVSTCARCHPPGQLDGENFAAGWSQARASTLFTTLRNTMPQDRPGSLTDEQYADVIAYMLQRNRVAAGAVALTTDTVALRQMRLDLPAAR